MVSENQSGENVAGCMSSSATCRASAKAAESPGDSMPTRLMSGGFSLSTETMKSLLRPLPVMTQGRIPE